MKILSVSRYGEDKEMLVVEFETKYGYGLNVKMNVVTKEIMVECAYAPADEILEAIEMVKSGKLEVEL